MSTNTVLGVTNVTLATNPLVMIVTGIVGAIGGLVAGIILFSNESKNISNEMNNMADGMEAVGESAGKLEDSMEQVANSINWENINLDFEAKFAILGSNSASAFKKNLLEGFNGFENDLTSKLKGMKIDLSPSSGGSGNYTPTIRSSQPVYQSLDISLYLDKHKVAEILYDPLTGIASQKGAI